MSKPMSKTWPDVLAIRLKNWGYAHGHVEANQQRLKVVAAWKAAVLYARDGFAAGRNGSVNEPYRWIYNEAFNERQRRSRPVSLNDPACLLYTDLGLFDEDLRRTVRKVYERTNMLDVEHERVLANTIIAAVEAQTARKNRHAHQASQETEAVQVVVAEAAVSEASGITSIFDAMSALRRPRDHGLERLPAPRPVRRGGR